MLRHGWWWTAALPAAVATLLMAAPAAAQGERRLTRATTDSRRMALVAGNDMYARTPLRNAANDARAVAAALGTLGFSVQSNHDATYKQFSQAVDRFVGTLRTGDTALVYYAGHGIQIEGENYLVPVDFDAMDETDAKYQAYSASRLADRIASSGAALTVLVLDACRNNPFRSSRSGASGGLAPMNGARGTLIAFAAAPGGVADDNPASGNGLFTTHLLRALTEPGLTVEQVFSRVRQDVYEASKGRQVPWLVSSVLGEFYFVPPSGAPLRTEAVPVPPPARPPVAATPVSNESSTGAATVTGTLRGRVVDGSKQPTAATITMVLRGGTARRFETRTNQRGEFLQIGLPPGTYSVTASHPTEGTQTVEATVRSGSWTDVTFQVSAAAALRRSGAARLAFNRGVLRWNEKKLDEAKVQFEEAVTIDPTFAEAWFQLGLTNVNLGLMGPAAGALEAYLEVAPDGPSASNAKALLSTIKK